MPSNKEAAGIPTLLALSAAGAIPFALSRQYEFQVRKDLEKQQLAAALSKLGTEKQAAGKAFLSRLLTAGTEAAQALSNFATAKPGWLTLGLGAGLTVPPLVAALSARPAETYGYRVNRSLHSLLDRIQADEATAEAFARTVGSETGKQVVGLASDLISKALHGAEETFSLTPARQSIFNKLREQDPILARADDATLSSAFDTMARFAPTLSTDANAVRSFLREAITTGGGPSYLTIRSLADAENQVTKDKDGKK